MSPPRAPARDEDDELDRLLRQLQAALDDVADRFRRLYAALRR